MVAFAHFVAGLPRAAKGQDPVSRVRRPVERGSVRRILVANLFHRKLLQRPGHRRCVALPGYLAHGVTMAEKDMSVSLVGRARLHAREA